MCLLLSVIHDNRKFEKSASYHFIYYIIYTPVNVPSISRIPYDQYSL